MKKILPFLLTMMFADQLLAKHTSGADLNYRCLGNGTYSVTYTFFVDCNGAQAPSSVILWVSNICGAVPTSYSLYQTTVTEVTNCYSSSYCNGGILTGIRKHLYQSVITLSDICSQWTLGVRSGGLRHGSNILKNASDYNLYVEATINNTGNICNNSPVFTNDPPINVCANQTYLIDPGIIDSENDSLVTSFINPLGQANVAIPYNTGYSVNYPMPLSEPLVINPSSGVFSFNSLSHIVTVYAIQISEYRNGVLIGQTSRDVMLYVNECTSTQPQINISNGIYNNIQACENIPVMIELFTTGSGSNDSTWLILENEIPGSTFTTVPGKNESGIFHWVPSSSDVSLTPHCFNAFVYNNECMSYQSNSSPFCITVYDSATCITLGYDKINPQIPELIINPQPVFDYMNVQFNNSHQQSVFYITDITGKKVFEKSIQLNEHYFEFDAGFLKPGIYIASIRNEKGLVVSQSKINKISSK